MAEPKIILAKGNLSMPEIRRLVANEESDEALLRRRKDEMSSRLAAALRAQLEGKTPAEVDRIERVWKDQNFQYHLANHPQLVLRWLLVGEGYDKAHHAMSGLLFGLQLSLDDLYKMGPGDTAMPVLQTMQKNMGGLNAVVTSLNATMSSGKAVVLTKVRLGAVVTDAVEAAYFSSVSPYNFKDVTKVEVDVAPDVGELVTDGNRLLLALNNCVTNAISAIESANQNFGKERGNRIAITASKVARNGVEYVRIDVSDNGCGFDPAEKEKLFQYWYSTKGEKGTGLGVPTTRDIAEELGGTFDLNSEGKDRGATATLTIPLRLSVS